VVHRSCFNLLYALNLLFRENKFVLVVQLLIQQNYRKIGINDKKSQIIIWVDFTAPELLFFCFSSKSFLWGNYLEVFKYVLRVSKHLLGISNHLLVASNLFYAYPNSYCAYLITYWSHPNCFACIQAVIVHI